MCTLNTTILSKNTSENFFNFQEKVTFVQNWPKNEFGKICKSYTWLGGWLCGNQWKFRSYSTHIYTKYYHSVRKEFLKFSRKIYIVYKIGPQNEFVKVFEVLPPCYVAINRNFSSHIYTHVYTKHCHSGCKDLLKVLSMF